MKTAKCFSTCYDSPAATFYEAGKEYEVDESREWIQAHFDVPKTKKKGRATEEEEDPPAGGEGGDPPATEPTPAGKGNGKGNGKKTTPGSLE